jgi:hypothetical protein
VGLIDDHREAVARQGPDLGSDHRKLLERGHDDGLSRLQRLAELAGGLVDVLHHAQRLLELTDRALELPVENPPIGDDHDRVEHAPVAEVVEGRELVSEPGNREALAAPGGMLDEVALTGSILPGVSDELADRVELLIAGEDEEALARFAAAVVLLLDLVDELADEVEDAVTRPRLFPEVPSRVAPLRRWNGRVAGAAEPPLVEGEEACLRAREVGGDVHLLGVHCEVGQAATVRKERLARISVGHVLANGILDRLTVQRVLQLGREDRDAVQEHDEIEAVLVLLAVAKLADHRE